MICAALACTVADLLEAEPVAAAEHGQDQQRAAGGDDGPVRPTPRKHGGRGTMLPPN